MMQNKAKEQLFLNHMFPSGDEDEIMYLVVGALHTSDQEAMSHNVVYEVDSKICLEKVSDNISSFNNSVLIEDTYIKMTVDFENIKGELGIAVNEATSYTAKYDISPITNHNSFKINSAAYRKFTNDEEDNDPNPNSSTVSHICQNDNIVDVKKAQYYKILMSYILNYVCIVFSDTPEFDVDEFVTDKAEYYNANDAEFHIYNAEVETIFKGTGKCLSITYEYNTLELVSDENDTYESACVKHIMMLVTANLLNQFKGE